MTTRINPNRLFQELSQLARSERRASAEPSQPRAETHFWCRTSALAIVPFATWLPLHASRWRAKLAATAKPLAQFVAVLTPRFWPVLCVMLMGTSLNAVEHPSPNLAKIERRIGKEPAYQGKPAYLLLSFGREAKHTIWLVRDGETLYVDRHATGDLDEADCRVTGETDRFDEILFKAGDLTLGGKQYADLQVVVSLAKRSAGFGLDEMPMFEELLAAQPESKLITVSVEVPFERPFPDLRDGGPVKGARHCAGQYDATGILQFSALPQDASIIHFGGAWTFGPDGQQKLVRGRNEDLVLRLGTPGRGPGTFACISYDHLVPNSAKPKLRIEYPLEPGNKPLVQSYVLEDRC